MVLGVVLLAWVAWSTWTAFRARSDLLAASTSATQLRSALTDGDQQRAEAELAALQDSADSAAGRTDGLTWRIAEQLPILGDDATAVAQISAAMADLGHQGLPPIVDVAGSLDAGSFAPRDGRLPLAKIKGLADPVTQASEAFTTADKRLGEVDTEHLLGAVKSRYDDAAGQISDASTTLQSAERAVQVLPSMLGADGDRRYLLLFQNNAEIRATGGMPGAMSVIDTNAGQISMGEQTTAGAFLELDHPVLPLTKEELALFGPQLGTYAQDANFTPDFARTADLIAAHWKRRTVTSPEPAHPLDGVLSMDPVALSYLLEATGPVEADGVTLTADNAVEELLNGTYLRLSDPEEQDAFFRDVARQVFDKAVSGAGDPATLLRALARGVEEHRLLVHSFDSAEQDVLAGTTVSGDFPADPSANPDVAVAFNDATATKMSYYLDYDVEVTARSCTDGTQELTGHLQMVSNAPKDAADLPESVTGPGLYGVPRGAQIVVADLYGPIDGTVTDVRLDGKRAGQTMRQFQGRRVAQVPLYFESGQSIELTWTMTAGADQAGSTDVWVTPGVHPENESSLTPSACH